MHAVADNTVLVRDRQRIVRGPWDRGKQNVEFRI